MPQRVFVSYSHRQKDWVKERLVPVIRASGAEVVRDEEAGVAGKSLKLQMKDWTERADHIVAVLSPDYLASAACGFEWKLSLLKDPGFQGGGVILPVLREDCALPKVLSGSGAPLYVDLRADRRGDRENALEEKWALLLRAWGGTLGARTVDWLHALEEVVRYLSADESVNLVSNGNASWRAVIAEAGGRLDGGLPVVDLGDPETRARPRFLDALARAVGLGGVPTNGEPGADILAFSAALRRSEPARVAVKHFCECRGLPGFDHEFFNTLRHHRNDDGAVVNGVSRRRLSLLLHTKTSLFDLLPTDQRDSWNDCKTVKLASAP